MKTESSNADIAEDARFIMRASFTIPYPNYPVSAPPLAAWERLVANLRQTAKVSRENLDSPVEPRGLRAMLMFVGAISDYLNTSPAILSEPELADPLLRLAAALVEVCAGRAPPLFQPLKSGGGNPGKSLPEQDFMATAARALDEFIKSGLNTEDAARTVLKAIVTADPGLPEIPNLTTATIKNWRYLLREGEGRAPSGALKGFEMELPESVGADHKERALWLLEQIKHAPLMRC